MVWHTIFAFDDHRDLAKLDASRDAVEIRVKSIKNFRLRKPTLTNCGSLQFKRSIQFGRFSRRTSKAAD
ncbi:hypothetical protein ACF1BQ_030265 [Bradyrhizobium sp. RDT10]